jgi:hypothetical protein
MMVSLGTLQDADQCDGQDFMERLRAATSRRSLAHGGCAEVVLVACHGCCSIRALSHRLIVMGRQAGIRDEIWRSGGGASADALIRSHTRRLIDKA